MSTLKMSLDLKERKWSVKSIKKFISILKFAVHVMIIQALNIKLGRLQHESCKNVSGKPGAWFCMDLNRVCMSAVINFA